MMLGTPEGAATSRRRIVTAESSAKPGMYARTIETLRGFIPSRRELEFTFLVMRRTLRGEVEFLRMLAGDAPRYELVVSVLFVAVGVAAGVLIATI